jgi:GGDEF domain-containing protein
VDAPALPITVAVKEPDGTQVSDPAPAPPAAALQPPADPLDAAVDSVVKAPPAQAPGRAADPLDSAVDDVVQQDKHDQELQAHFTAWRTQNAKASPEQALDVLKYSAASGLEPAAVADNLEELKKTVDLHQLAARLQASPGLTKFMADAGKAPLVKDDTAALSGLEWALTGRWENGHLVQPPAYGAALRDSIMQQQYIELANREAAGAKFSPEQQKQLDELEQRYGGDRDYGADGIVSRAWLGLWKTLPYIAGTIASGTLGGEAAAALGASGGAAGGAALGLPEGGVAAAPGAAAGAFGGAVAGEAAGATLGVAAWNFYQNYGPQYRQLRRLKDGDGNTLLTEEQARTYAGAASFVAAGLMTGALGWMLKKVPGADKVLGKIGADAVSTALTQQTVGRALLMAPVKLGTNIAAGGVFMAGQAAANAASEELAKATHGQEGSLARVVDTAGEAFKRGVVDMGFLSLGGAGAEFLHDMGQAYRLQTDALRFQTEAAQAEQSKLLQRSPEAFEEVHRLAQGDNVQRRYIDVGAWDRYWQEHNLQPGEVAARVMGDGGKAYLDAMQRGGELSIPAEKFMSNFARTEHLAGLADDVRFTQDGVSPREARARHEALATDAQAQGEPVEDDGTQQIREDYAAKARAAGVAPKVADSVAALTAAAFRNLAKAQGVTPLELYQRQDVNVVRGEGRPRTEDASFAFGENAGTADLLEEARSAISRMGPEKRQMALDWMEYATGERTERPAITPDLERQLARFGVVGPQGYTFDEKGRSMERPVTTQKVRGPEPEEFRRIREAKREHDTGRSFHDILKQNLRESLHPEATRLLEKQTRGHTPEQRADDIYRDHATGALNETAFRETPVPEGKQLAFFDVGNVKNVNDHPEHGGHEVADGVLRQVARALQQAHDGDVYMVRGGFRAYVKDAAEAQRIVRDVNAKVADADFPVVTAVGKEPKSASAAINKAKDAMRAKGAYPERDKLSPALEKRLPTLKTSEERATPPVPRALVEAAGKLTRKAAFEKAYVEEETGLLTAKGWNRIPRKKYVAAIDLRELGRLNKVHGQEFGDDFLRHFAQQATASGGADFDFAHRSGDEYLAQSDDREALVQHLDALRTQLESVKLPAPRSGPGEHADIVVQFRHGIGEGEHAELAADRELNRQRADEKANADAHRAPRRDGEDRGEVRARREGQPPNRPGRPQAFPAEVDRLEQPAYHGTPHDFDEFKLEHIGSGEGAQVYGHGLYFAGNRSVAEGYRERLARPLPTIDDRDIESLSSVERHAMQAVHMARENLGRGKLSFEKALPEAVAKLEREVDLRARGISPSAPEDNTQVQRLRQSEQALALLKELTHDRISEKGGKLFRVNLPEDHELLDHDRKEQPPGVIEKLKSSGLAAEILKAADEGWLEFHPTEGAEGLAQIRQPIENFGGRSIYKFLVETRGSAEGASAALREAGIPGLRYLDQGSRAQGEGTHNYVIWDDARVKVLDKLYQDDLGNGFRLNAGKGRGYIEFSPPDESGRPRRFDIHILKAADQSTFAHETMHFLFEVMGDVATSPTASEDVKRDYQALLNFAGHESHEARQQAMSERRELADIQRTEGKLTPEQKARQQELTAKEERITHAWEQYLAEGKAPSAELAGAFARFRNWMVRLYRNIQGVAQQYQDAFGEELGLSDEVRSVFDRLLASDEEIRKAQAASEAGQPFQPALERMTPEERMSYLGALSEAQENAKTELIRRIASAQRSENAQWAREERQRLQEEVDQDLDGQPVYRTLKALQAKGEDVPEVLRGKDGEPLRLDRAALVKAYGPDFVRTLPRGLVAAKGQEGVPAEHLAGLLGWDSGDAMVRALQQAQPRARLVQAEVQRRMEELYGPTLLDNPEELAKAAMDAVHNPAAARKAVLELNALRRALVKAGGDLNADRAAFDKLQEQVGQERQARAEGDARAKADAAQQATVQRQLRAELLHGFDFATYREAAKQAIPEKSVGELTAGDRGLAGQYERAERTMAKRALEAAAKGDLLGAIALKEKQLLNLALYMEARDAREALERGFEKVRQSAREPWRQALGKADPDVFRTTHDALLQALGLTEPREGAPKASIDAVARLGGADIGFDVEAIKDLLASPKPWAQLSAAEALNVVDAVSNIRHLANAQAEVNLAGRKQTTDAFFADLQATSKARKPLPPEPASRTAAGRACPAWCASCAASARGGRAARQHRGLRRDARRRGPRRPAAPAPGGRAARVPGQGDGAPEAGARARRKSVQGHPEEHREAQGQPRGQVGGTPMDALLPGAAGRGGAHLARLHAGQPLDALAQLGQRGQQAAHPGRQRLVRRQRGEGPRHPHEAGDGLPPDRARQHRISAARARARARKPHGAAARPGGSHAHQHQRDGVPGRLLPAEVRLALRAPGRGAGGGRGGRALPGRLHLAHRRERAHEVTPREGERTGGPELGRAAGAPGAGHPRRQLRGLGASGGSRHAGPRGPLAADDDAVPRARVLGGVRPVAARRRERPGGLCRRRRVCLPRRGGRLHALQAVHRHHGAQCPEHPCAPCGSAHHTHEGRTPTPHQQRLRQDDGPRDSARGRAHPRVRGHSAVRGDGVPGRAVLREPAQGHGGDGA